MLRAFKEVIWLFVILVGATGLARAADLQPPTGDVILEVTGKIANTTDGKSALFDLEGVKSLGRASLDTSTQWTEGVIHFEGIGGADFIRALGASGTEVVARALNDYEIVIPIEDFTNDYALIAYSMNGQPMSVRDKGPLWIVYPYDQSSDFRTDRYLGRSIWQLKYLEFR